MVPNLVLGRSTVADTAINAELGRVIDIFEQYVCVRTLYASDLSAICILICLDGSLDSRCLNAVICHLF